MITAKNGEVSGRGLPHKLSRPSKIRMTHPTSSKNMHVDNARNLWHVNYSAFSDKVKRNYHFLSTSRNGKKSFVFTEQYRLLSGKPYSALR
jgi:hypothetical protein